MFCYQQLVGQTEGLESYYKARLMGIFLSAIYLEPVITITFMVKQNCLDSLFNLIIAKSAYFICDYDRKVLVLGLASLFAAKLKENQVDDLAVKCFECGCLALHVQRIEQNKLAGFYKSRVMKMPDEAEEIKLRDDILEKFRVMAEINDDDFEDDDDIGSDAEDDQEREEMEVLRALMSKKGKAQISLKNFDTKLLKVDEYQTFIDLIKEIKVILG
jgi:hypothetical protein